MTAIPYPSLLTNDESASALLHKHDALALDASLNCSPAFIYIDLFCGGGGTTMGLRSARNKFGQYIVMVAAAVNHDPGAILSHWKNHPDVEHFEEDIRTLDITRLRRLIDIYRAFYPQAKIVLWASCECTNLSKAKGGLPRDRDSRTLANDLFRYIEELTPDYVQLENVEEFLSWGPLDDQGKPVSRSNGLDYVKWKQHIEAYGYRYDYRLLNAADFGAHTKRIRYFGVFAKGDLPISWPAPTHAKKAQDDMFSQLQKWRPVKEVLDFAEEGNSIITSSLKETSPAAAWKYLNAEVEIVSKITRKKNTRPYTADYVTLRQVVLLPKSVTTPDIGMQPRLVLTQGHAGSFMTKVIEYARQQGLTLRQVSFYKYTPLCEKTLSRVYAGLIKYVAGGEKAFFQQANTGPATSMVTDIDQPCRTLTAKGGNLSLVQTHTLPHRPSIQDRFITKYYGNGGQLSSVDDPAGTLTTKDRMALTRLSLLDDNSTSSRKHHYLLNPQYQSAGNSMEEPCFTLIARMDKAPPHLVSVENGAVCVKVFRTDSTSLIKIKEFMVIYGVLDIKMRMLKIPELKRIQGFPEDYFLAGSQASQKKYIGNAVVPVIPQRWVEAMEKDLQHYFEEKMAA